MPALSEAVAVSARIGIDLRGHRATVLRPGELHDVNLILGFEPAHVAAAVIHGRAARERSFTLPELAVLLEAVAIPFPRPGPVELLERAHLSRSSMNSAPSITDPLGGTPGLFMRTVAEIDRYVGTIARALFGASENCAGAVRHP